MGYHLGIMGAVWIMWIVPDLELAAGLKLHFIFGEFNTHKG